MLHCDPHIFIMGPIPGCIPNPSMSCDGASEASMGGIRHASARCSGCAAGLLLPWPGRGGEALLGAGLPSVDSLMRSMSRLSSLAAS